MLPGTCHRVRLLNLVENFALFSEHKAALVKTIRHMPVSCDRPDMMEFIRHAAGVERR